MGNGLVRQLERRRHTVDRYRRMMAANRTLEMGLTPGEATLLAERYDPDDIDADWTHEAIRAWLDDRYAGAVYIDEENTDG